jgi:hypothetical protein
VLAALAAFLLVVLGTFHVAQGLAALITGDRFLVGNADPVGGLGVTAWGWLHVLLGAVVVAAGVLVLAGRRWARAVGVVVCVLSALSALSFLESHPGWALTVLVVDVLIVVALTVHGSEIRAG